MSKPLKCICLDFNRWSFYLYNMRLVGTLKYLDNYMRVKLLAEMNTIEYSPRNHVNLNPTVTNLVFIKLTSNKDNNSIMAQICRRCDKKHNYGLMFYLFLIENFETLSTHNEESESKENTNG